MPIGTSFAGALLRLIFSNVACVNVGDASGLQPSAVAGSAHVSLHTADPGAAGSQTTNEATYTDYARIPITRNAGAWTLVGNYLENAGTITFPAVGAGTGTITHVAVGFALAGAGLLYAFDELTTPKNFDPGDVMEFAPGELKIKLLDA